MSTERDLVRDITVAGGAVILFAIAVIIISLQTYENGFSPSGAFWLVGAIAGFVLVMLFSGYVFLNR